MASPVGYLLKKYYFLLFHDALSLTVFIILGLVLFLLPYHVGKCRFNTHAPYHFLAPSALLLYRLLTTLSKFYFTFSAHISSLSKSWYHFSILTNILNLTQYCTTVNLTNFLSFFTYHMVNEHLDQSTDSCNSTRDLPPTKYIEVLIFLAVFKSTY